MSAWVAERLAVWREADLRLLSRVAPMPADPAAARSAAENVTVLFYRHRTREMAEWAWARMLCEEALRRHAGPAAFVVVEAADAETPTVADLLDATRTRGIAVVADDTVLWGPVGWTPMWRALAERPELGAIGPVSNEAVVPAQRAAPAFAYQTPSLFRLACMRRFREFAGRWEPSPALDPFAFLASRAHLARLDPRTPLAEIPAALSAAGAALGVALDTYVHRFVGMYEQPRTEIEAAVPRDARHILDVGCGGGGVGAALKARQKCRVVGLELDQALAASAASRLDEVIRGDVERMPADAFDEVFDCIVCGDVLEHLIDPWAAVSKLATWLAPGGRIVAAVPNVGHWSIVADLLHGRWDVVPFGLLCWAHFRFFTRAGVERLFRVPGLVVERIESVGEDLPPIGLAFVRRAARLVPAADAESLRTVKFLVVGRRSTSDRPACGGGYAANGR